MPCVCGDGVPAKAGNGPDGTQASKKYQIVF